MVPKTYGVPLLHSQLNICTNGFTVHCNVCIFPGPPVPDFVRSRSQSVVSVDAPGAAQRISEQTRPQRSVLSTLIHSNTDNSNLYMTLIIQTCIRPRLK